MITLINKYGKIILKWILKHRIFVTFIIILSISILPEILHFVFSQNLTGISYYIQIITNIFLMAGVVIAVWQYYISTASTLTIIKSNRIEKAIELTLFYKTNILQLYSPIIYVYNNSGITDIIKSIKKSDMKNFDDIEFQSLLSEKDRDSLRKVTTSDKFIKSVFEADKAYCLNLNLDGCIISRKCENTSNPKSTKVTVEYDGNKIATAFISNIVFELLNNMEYFSMNSVHNIADFDSIYPSIHQTYLSIIQLLYCNISNENTEGFYKNTIKLYNKWYNQSQKTSDKIAQYKRSTPIGTSVENID